MRASVVHVAVGCNRVAGVLDWGRCGLAAFGAHHFVAIYDPKVGAFHQCACITPAHALEVATLSSWHGFGVNFTTLINQECPYYCRIACTIFWCVEQAEPTPLNAIPTRTSQRLQLFCESCKLSSWRCNLGSTDPVQKFAVPMGQLVTVSTKLAVPFGCPHCGIMHWL